MTYKFLNEDEKETKIRFLLDSDDLTVWSYVNGEVGDSLTNLTHAHYNDERVFPTQYS